MVQGTAVVWLPVSDVAKSVSFYRDLLGLREVRNEGQWAELDANGLHIGLNETESPHGSGGGVIAFAPEGGIESAVNELRDAGVKIAGEVSDHPWGRVATLKDPDDNDLQLYEPPSK